MLKKYPLRVDGVVVFKSVHGFASSLACENQLVLFEPTPLKIKARTSSPSAYRANFTCNFKYEYHCPNVTSEPLRFQCHVGLYRTICKLISPAVQ